MGCGAGDEDECQMRLDMYDAGSPNKSGDTSRLRWADWFVLSVLNSRAGMNKFPSISWFHLKDSQQRVHVNSYKIKR